MAAVPSVRVSAPAHTQTPSDESVAVAGRFVAVLDRALPFLGPTLAAVLGLVALGRRALVVDEASLLAAAQGSFSDVIDRAISDDPAGRATSRCSSPSSQAGDSELWLRLPSVLAGIVAAAAVYLLGRRLAGRYAGAAASLVLASSVGVVSLTRAVGPLAFALAAMLVSSALFARSVERGNALWWAVYALSAVLLPLTHPIAVSALAAQLVAAAFAWRGASSTAARACRRSPSRSSSAGSSSSLPGSTAPMPPTVRARSSSATDRAGVGRALGWSPVVAALALWGIVSLYRGSTAPARALAARARGRAGADAARLRARRRRRGPRLPASRAHRRGRRLRARRRHRPRRDHRTAGSASRPARPSRSSRSRRSPRLRRRASGELARCGAPRPREDEREGHRRRAPGEGASGVLLLRARAPDQPRRSRRRSFRRHRGRPGARRRRRARQVVSPPRYALLSEEHAGDGLVVQRWIRP